MTEKEYFVYEWSLDEEVGSYLCLGQVFILEATYDAKDDVWWGICWDNNPHDPRWGESEPEPVVQAPHQLVEQALDWCEDMDIKEANFDASQYNN